MHRRVVARYLVAKMQKRALRMRELSRMLERGGKFGIVSAYRGEHSKRQNKLRQGELRMELEKRGYRNIEELKSHWTEDGVTTKEKSFLVPDIKPDDLFELGKKYDQEATIYKGGDGVIGMYFPEGEYAHVAVDPKGEHAFEMSQDQELYSKPGRDWSFEFGFLWGDKIPWDGENPVNRKQVKEEVRPQGETRDWNRFMSERYDKGKKKVRNPNPDTKAQHPQVSVNHLMKTDPGFKKRIRREFKDWSGSQRVAARWYRAQ